MYALLHFLQQLLFLCQDSGIILLPGQFRLFFRKHLAQHIVQLNLVAQRGVHLDFFFFHLSAQPLVYQPLLAQLLLQLFFLSGSVAEH